MKSMPWWLKVLAIAGVSGLFYLWAKCIWLPIVSCKSQFEGSTQAKKPHFVKYNPHIRQYR